MKMIRARELRAAQIPAPNALNREDLVLTLRGKPIALVLPVDSDNLALSLRLAARMRAERAIRNAQRRSVALGLDKMTMHEIDVEIKAARVKKLKKKCPAEGTRRIR